LWPEKEQARSDICTVGVANGDDLPIAKLIFGRGGGDKVSEFMGPENQILLIEHAFGETPEETRHAIFENLSSGTEQRRTRVQGLAETKQIILVPAGAMEKKKDRFAGPGWHESMGESFRGRHGVNMDGNVRSS
jgi:hypothetical protein